MRNHYFSEHKSETSNLVWKLGVMIDPAFEKAEWFPGLLPILLNRGKVDYSKDCEERVEAIGVETSGETSGLGKVAEGAVTGVAYTAAAAIAIPYFVIMGTALLVCVGGFWMLVAALVL